MSELKLLVMDVDGTLTNGKIYIGNDGEFVKAFNVRDGYGITHILPEVNIQPMIITGRSSKILEMRCSELNIELLFQGIENKLQKLQEVLTEININPYETAYIGDDLNDIECMQFIQDNGGFIACPSDAVNAVKDIADYVADAAGGNGAVRNLIEHLHKLQSKKQL